MMIAVRCLSLPANDRQYQSNYKHQVQKRLFLLSSDHSCQKQNHGKFGNRTAERKEDSSESHLLELL